MPSDFPPVWSLPGMIVGYLVQNLPCSGQSGGRSCPERPLRDAPDSDAAEALTDLAKLLYNDGRDPLAGSRPTAKQLAALIYDPAIPEDPPDADRGYRIFARDTVTQTLTTPATTLAVWLGGLRNDDDFDILTAEIDLRVLCSVDSETILPTEAVSQGDGSPDSQSESERTVPLTQTLITSRSTLMAQALLAALVGLCFNGVGTIRLASADRITDDRQRCGYLLKLELDYVL